MVSENSQLGARAASHRTQGTDGKDESWRKPSSGIQIQATTSQNPVLPTSGPREGSREPPPQVGKSRSAEPSAPRQHSLRYAWASFQKNVSFLNLICLFCLCRVLVAGPAFPSGGVRASPARAPLVVTPGLQGTGSVVAAPRLRRLQRVESACMGRQIVNHWTTGKTWASLKGQVSSGPACLTLSVASRWF